MDFGLQSHKQHLPYNSNMKTSDVGATQAAGVPVEGRAAVGRLLGVVKAYPMGNRQYLVLRGVDLTLYSGEFTAIVGPSGAVNLPS